MKRVILLMIVIAASGCGISKTCTTILIPGIALTLRDSVSLGPIDAAEIKAKAVDGSYADSVRLSARDLGPEGLVWLVDERERPGLYHVTVDATGYARWERSNVRVPLDEDGCHVETAKLTALLQRTS